jgi:hypothetical protein
MRGLQEPDKSSGLRMWRWAVSAIDCVAGGLPFGFESCLQVDTMRRRVWAEDGSRR